MATTNQIDDNLSDSEEQSDAIYKFLEKKNQQRQEESKESILRIRVGSHLYGINRPESDEDFMSIWIPSTSQLIGLTQIKQQDTKENLKEEVKYPINLFFRHCLKNNPNMLEILFANEQNILSATEEGRMILENRNLFLSKKICKSRFFGYAQSQRKKLTYKRERIQRFMDALDRVKGWKAKGFEYSPERIEITSDLNERGKWAAYEKGSEINKLYDQLVAVLEEYGWRKDLIEKYGYDTKFAANLIRILSEGVELLSTHQLTFPLKSGALMRDIRDGKHKLDDVIKMSEDLEKQLLDTWSQSTLQEEPIYEEVEHLLISLTLDKWGLQYVREDERII